jgi:hypothetical protein
MVWWSKQTLDDDGNKKLRNYKYFKVTMRNNDLSYCIKADFSFISSGYYFQITDFIVRRRLALFPMCGCEEFVSSLRRAGHR